MTWTTLIALAAGTYALKWLGLGVMRGRTLSPRWQVLLAFLPAALIAALAAIQTVATPDGLVVDARLAGMVAAGGAVVARAPFAIVVAVAVVTAAALRGVGIG